MFGTQFKRRQGRWSEPRFTDLLGSRTQPDRRFWNSPRAEEPLLSGRSVKFHTGVWSRYLVDESTAFLLGWNFRFFTKVYENDRIIRE